MKKTSLTALALTGALALGAVPAHAQDNDKDHRVEEVTNAAIKAFEAHGENTYTANAWFSVDGIGEGVDVEWAIPISVSQELIDFIAPSDERFRAALDDPKPVEDYTNPVGKPTPARAANGQIVVVLPHSGAVTVEGGIVIEDLQSGDMVQMTEDKQSLVPVVSPGVDVKLLYGAGDKTSTYDPSGAATQSVGNNGHMAQYTRDNGETGTVIENERGEEKDVDINLAGNIDNLPVLNPGDRVRLTIDANVTNTSGQDLIYSVQPYGTTEDVEVDKRDGTEDGLYPITDEDDRPIEGRATVSGDGNDTQVTVEFVVPDDGLVYLNHRLLDTDGNDVAPQKMDTIMVAEPEMDVQASTESGNSKMVDGKQTIYNQAAITNLTPGKPYQVLVNLFQCDAPGDCSEIAAVNREIIPRNNNSIQNFSVLVDANSLGSSDSTLEWETRLYEGTGDIYNMGDLIHEVADRGENQVISPSGSRTSLDAKRTQQSGTVNAQGGDVTEVEVNDNGLEVGDEEPPASIDQVRSNNEELSEQNESRLAGQWIGTAIVTAIVLLTIAGFAVAAFFRGKSRRADKREKSKGSTAVVTGGEVDSIDGEEIIDDNNGGGSNGRGR